VEGLLYAGTDDGRIQVSENGGASWRAIERLPGITDSFFVNDIKADLHDADTVYVVVDDHKSGDFTPYIFRSGNRGGTWSLISEGLPKRHVAWRIVQDHVNPGLLFAATEFGVFFTVDGGDKWVKLSGGAPTISFRDLAIQKRENDLVGATFGRGFWILDDYTPLRSLSEQALQREAILFPVKDALWYLPKWPLGDWKENRKAYQGDELFVAPNPPFGAIFTYYLKDGLETALEQRRKDEKTLERAGDDTPYPGWEALRAEEIEDAPAIILTVSDAKGELVRRIEGPLTPGFHRVAWDLRYPRSEAWAPPAEGPAYIDFPGPLAAPGRYTVGLAKRINGQMSDLGTPQSFEVVPMRQRGLPGASPDEMVAFALRLDGLSRQVSGADAAVSEFLAEAAAIKETLLRSQAPDSLRDQARTIELELLDIHQKLAGNEARSFYGDEGPVSIKRRLEVAITGTFRSTYGPTPTHVRMVEIAESEFSGVKDQMERLSDSDLPALRRELDAAGVPWTPGRGVPAN
jgi:hypothetical protein